MRLRRTQVVDFPSPFSFEELEMVVYNGTLQTELNLAQQAERKVRRLGRNHLRKNPEKVARLAASMAKANDLYDREAAEYLCQEICPDSDDFLEQVCDLLD